VVVTPATVLALVILETHPDAVTIAEALAEATAERTTAVEILATTKVVATTAERTTALAIPATTREAATTAITPAAGTGAVRAISV
jgi:hypothetical protein